MIMPAMTLSYKSGNAAAVYNAPAALSLYGCDMFIITSLFDTVVKECVYPYL